MRAYLLIACAVPYMVFFGHGYARLTLGLYDPHSTDLSGHLTNQVSIRPAALGQGHCLGTQRRDSYRHGSGPKVARPGVARPGMAGPGVARPGGGLSCPCGSLQYLSFGHSRTSW